MKYSSTVFVALVFLVCSTYAEDPWTPSALCPFPSEDLTRFPYEGDCSKYWECYEGARYPMDCPSGLEYNANASRCDSPDIANCDPDATIIYPTFSHSTVTTLSTATTKDPGPLPECPFPSDELTFYPVINNCSQYWECFQGNRYLMTCPSGLVWNTNFNYCDYQANVDCNRNTSTSSTSTSTSTTPTGTTGTTETPTSTTSESPSWTPDPLCPYPSSKMTFYPYPGDCSKFYQCDRGNKFVMTCPIGLYWYQADYSCRPKATVDCEDSTLTPTSTTSTTTVTTSPTTVTTSPTTVTTSPTTPNPICIGQPNGIYLADPYDCSKYYECVNQTATVGQCPDGLYWSVAAHTCDFPENVACSVSTTTNA